MSHSLRCVIGLIAVFCAAAQAADAPPALEVKAWASSSAAIPSIHSVAPREFLAAEPAYKSARVQYLTLEMGDARDRFITMALDESQGAGAGFDTLYADANNNNDLTDDLPQRVTVEKRQRVTHLAIEPFTVAVRYASGVAREVTLSCASCEVNDAGAVAVKAAFAPGSCLEGKVAIGNRPDVRIAIYDSADVLSARQPNGCFNDYGADRMRVDCNGDGRLDDTEETALSKVIALDGKLWDCEIDPAGTSVRVTPSSRPTGLLTVAAAYGEGVAAEDAFVELTSRAGWAFRCVVGGKEPFVIPAGTYRLSAGSVTLPGAEGAKWNARFSMEREITVEPDKPCRIALGAPLVLAPVVTGRSTTGGAVRISHRFVGRGGEIYSVISGGEKPVPPSVKIIDTEGIAILRGAMEPGGEYAWRIPANLMLTEGDYGPVTVIVTAEAGPFGGMVEGRKRMIIRR